MRSLHYKSIRTVVAAYLLYAAGPANAATIELQFDSLPSAQGWSYQGMLPEANVATATGTSLIIDTMGHGAVTAYFFMDNLVQPNLPFTLSVRARVLDSETQFWPLNFQAREGFEVWSANLGLDSINLPGLTIQPFDGTQFHDFRIEGTPGLQSDFYIDDVLVQSMLPFVSNVSAQWIAFGDGNAVGSDANGRFEISQFSFIQPIPLPAALPLFAFALITLGFRFSKYRSENE